MKDSEDIREFSRIDTLLRVRRIHRERSARGLHGRRLTPAQVLEIRANSTARVDLLAAKYLVTPKTITDIIAGRTWAWLKQETA